MRYAKYGGKKHEKRSRSDDMGLEKSIKSGKERRKQYRGAKGVDRSCRNHGSCPYCEENRRYRERRLKIDKKYLKEILTKEEI